MTKKRFISELTHNGYVTLTDRAVDAIDEFFSQNVVIPRGATLQVAGTELIEFGGEQRVWHDLVTIHDSHEYRIKPPEPALEYQWLCTVGGYATVSDYITEEKLKDVYAAPESWTKIEETKRIRQKGLENDT